MDVDSSGECRARDICVCAEWDRLGVGSRGVWIATKWEGLYRREILRRRRVMFIREVLGSVDCSLFQRYSIYIIIQ